jgi:hypothetical protein
VFAACALVFAGCTSNSATSSSTESPVTKLFGTADELRTRQRTVEQAVAKCMTAKGWTYTPVDADTVFGALTSADPLTDARFRDSYGYGIVNKAPSSPSANGNIATDPNAEYVATLSDEKQLQYGVDLDGPNVTPQPPIAQRQGCRAEANRTVAGSTFFDDPKYLAAFEDLTIRSDNDPRTTTAIEKWSACMNAAGHPYVNPDDITPDLQSQLADLGEPADPTGLTVLEAREIATAKADAACTTKHLDKVNRQLDQEIYNDLIAQFPELKRA